MEVKTCLECVQEKMREEGLMTTNLDNSFRELSHKGEQRDGQWAEVGVGSRDPISK